MPWTSVQSNALQEMVKPLYEGPGRHYHTWAHIEACLKHLKSWEVVLPESPSFFVLHAALVLHDAIYNTHSDTNEEDSASLVDLYCGSMVPEDIAEVKRLIMLTKSHRVSPLDYAGQLICDIDLAILGTYPYDYDQYVKKVRLEYGWVSDDAWREGRARLLEDFLERTYIYHTKAFWSREGRARHNLVRELNTLQ